MLEFRACCRVWGSWSLGFTVGLGLLAFKVYCRVPGFGEGLLVKI